MQQNKLPFNQKHPLLFGLMLVMAAVALFAGAMAALRLSGTHVRGGVFKSDRLGVCRIEGFIQDSEAVNNWLHTLRTDKTIRGVLLRIDSPGGAVAPSQEMYNAVRRLAKEKPVVVSMGSVAASGGYYIAAGANHIVANPSTLTGSIGVKMELANLEGLMGKIGINHLALTSGDLKNAGTPYRAMTEKEREYLQGLVTDMYEQFLEAIATGRNMDLETIRKSADGRALTGRQAKELGFVDTLGDMETAVSILKSMCTMPEEAEVELLDGPPKETNMLRELLSSALGFDPASVLAPALHQQVPVRFLYY